MTKPRPAVFQINDRWRLTEDGDVQWILQRESPKAKHDRNRWQSVAYCGTREYDPLPPRQLSAQRRTTQGIRRRAAAT